MQLNKTRQKKELEFLMQKKRKIKLGASLFFLSFLGLSLTNNDIRKFFYNPAESIDHREVDSWTDTAIWSLSSSLPKNLYIVPNQPELGYITYSDSKLSFVRGKENYIFWSYEDYSSLKKITVSTDKTIVRAFVTFTVFKSEKLIFEFNTKTKMRRKYSIKNN